MRTTLELKEIPSFIKEGMTDGQKHLVVESFKRDGFIPLPLEYQLLSQHEEIIAESVAYAMKPEYEIGLALEEEGQLEDASRCFLFAHYNAYRILEAYSNIENSYKLIDELSDSSRPLKELK